MPNGIRKARPVVIVMPTDQLSPAGPFDVVAVTSRLPDPLPDDHVLPWHPRGHPRTGLNRKCAAVCNWLAHIVDNDIQDVGGIVPTGLMRTILEKVAAASAPPSAPGVPTPPQGADEDDTTGSNGGATARR